MRSAGQHPAEDEAAAVRLAGGGELGEVEAAAVRLAKDAGRIEVVAQDGVHVGGVRAVEQQQLRGVLEEIQTVRRKQLADACDNARTVPYFPILY